MPPLVVVGTDGLGREAAAWIEQAGRGAEFVGFLDDGSSVSEDVAGYPVLGGLGWLQANRHAEVVVALRSPAARSLVVRQLDMLGVALAIVVHPSARVGPRVTLADGVIVCPGVLLASDVAVGRAAMLNCGVVVGHDSRIGDFAFLDLSARVGGWVTVGSRADVGIAVTIADGVTIGARATIGPAAVVSYDVNPRTAVAGIRHRRDDWH